MLQLRLSQVYKQRRLSQVCAGRENANFNLLCERERERERKRERERERERERGGKREKEKKCRYSRLTIKL